MQEQINNTSMLKVGTILRGTYRIDSYLSSGGFGNTYVATNIEFEERVAIKEFFMKGVTQRDENQTTVSVSNAENHNSFLEQKEKFKKEARRIRLLKNEHIVAVHDLFEENGTAYYVMDYVDGENLAERLKRTDKPMTEQEVREILPQILDALKSVHDAGIWHLDLKPANIMLTQEGKVKLIDFGASKQLNAQKGGATTSTAISYTNGYAPREQMEQNYDKFGPWTDIYALGATLYTLLSNKRPPLPTDIDDDISEDKYNVLPLPNEVQNTSLHKVILWMMSTNRNKRPQNVNEILVRLEDNTAAKEDDTDEETIVAVPVKDEHRFEGNHIKMKSVQSYDFEPQSHSDNSNKRTNFGKTIIIGGIVLIFIAIGFLLWSNTSLGEDSKNMSSMIEDTAKIAKTNIVENLEVESPLGVFKYSGSINENNQPNGFGKATFDDGRQYNGEFVNGVMSGKGSHFNYPNGDVFVGTFKDNAFYEGTYTIAEDGSYFTGTFKNGQPDKGKWFDKTGKLL